MAFSTLNPESDPQSVPLEIAEEGPVAENLEILQVHSDSFDQDLYLQAKAFLDLVS